MTNTLAPRARVDILGEALYELHHDRIHRYFSSRIFNLIEAQDLSQTVFLKIITSLKSGLWDGKGGIAYLFTVARNTLIDHYRKNKHASIVSDEMVETYAGSVMHTSLVESGEQREAIRSAMQYLTPGEQEAITLRFFSDMEYPAIAKQLGKRENSVRQLVCRGTRALRVHLADLEW